MPKTAQNKFIKQNQASPYYRFVKYMAKGVSNPFLVESENEKKSEYVLKRGLDDDQTIYWDIADKELTSEQRLEEKLKRKRSEISRVALFHQEKDRFTVELIRSIAPDCAPKSYTFFQTQKSNSNKKFPKHHLPYTGTKYLKNYQDWSKLENSQLNEIDNHSINKDGFLYLNTDENPETKPIFGMGYCAVIIHILMIADMDTDNWGLSKFFNYYLTKIIDSDSSFFEEESDLQNITNAIDILKLAFFKMIPFNQSYPALPKELYSSEFIQKEVYMAIQYIKELLDNGHFKKFIMNFFVDFKFFREPLLRRIENNIKTIYDNTLEASDLFFQRTRGFYPNSSIVTIDEDEVEIDTIVDESGLSDNSDSEDDEGLYFFMLHQKKRFNI